MAPSPNTIKTTLAAMPPHSESFLPNISDLLCPCASIDRHRFVRSASRAIGVATDLECGKPEAGVVASAEARSGCDSDTPLGTGDPYEGATSHDHVFQLVATAGG